ncbi:MAG: glycosyltransferase [Sedimentisphaerales bacterium]|nr:glycosyltransferase [Sedimentisphaerales bacterium]
MNIDILFLAYNRLPCTKISIPALLADPEEEFSLTLWDNGSTDGTREYLDSLDDPRIVRTVFAKENVRLQGAVNDLVERSKADLIGMVFEDILVTPGWTRTLAQAHADIPKFGMIGSWHFPLEDFDYELARPKIHTYGSHQLILNPWTGVGAGLVKRRAMQECGPLQSSRTTYYWIQMALKGYVNGYYYPLIPADHMDDPRSPYTLIKTEEDFQRLRPPTAAGHGVTCLADWIERCHQDAIHIQTLDPDPRQYVGWRAKWRRLVRKITQSA